MILKILVAACYEKECAQLLTGFKGDSALHEMCLQEAPQRHFRRAKNHEIFGFGPTDLVVKRLVCIALLLSEVSEKDIIFEIKFTKFSPKLAPLFAPNF